MGGTVPCRAVSQADLRWGNGGLTDREESHNALPYLVLELDRGVVGEDANELGPEADTLMGMIAMGLGVARGVV